MPNAKCQMQTARSTTSTSHLLSPPQCQITNATIFDGDLFIVILGTQAAAAITTNRSCINCCIYVHSVFIFTIRKPLYYYSLLFTLPTVNRYDRYLFNSITWGQKPSWICIPSSRQKTFADVHQRVQWQCESRDLSGIGVIHHGEHARALVSSLLWTHHGQTRVFVLQKWYHGIKCWRFLRAGGLGVTRRPPDVFAIVLSYLRTYI